MPIVITSTAMFPKLFFLNGLNTSNSKPAPNIPQIITDKTSESSKLNPKGGVFSKKIYRDVGRLEKKDAMIAPKAIISPWAKLTIRVTPYSNESATEATEIIMPNNKPFPNWSIT